MLISRNIFQKWVISTLCKLCWFHDFFLKTFVKWIDCPVSTSRLICRLDKIFCNWSYLLHFWVLWICLIWRLFSWNWLLCFSFHYLSYHFQVRHQEICWSGVFFFKVVIYATMCLPPRSGYHYVLPPGSNAPPPKKVWTFWFVFLREKNQEA